MEGWKGEGEHTCEDGGCVSLASQTQPTQMWITFSIVNGEGSGDAQ